MSTKVLADKDVNAPMTEQPATKDVKSMEYHRQVFQSKMAEEETANKYVSPSDNIMSPCSAKINALRNKHASKFVSLLDPSDNNNRLTSFYRAKPKSLFAQASAKKLQGDNPLGAKPAPAKAAFQL
ncbi:hypothetical protein F53441_6084 [Fusarium austroafricanum]|uniref:Spo12-like protein n=1 Tax=Fusarium austroafricanum TaxID=2364996 RepID=A0A8H4KIM1_9HYPO|nr:hypothetical protein F53441_6084 [Fusarium austroafricanum]